MIAWLQDVLERLAAWWCGDLRVLCVEGDTLPLKIPQKRLVHMVEDDVSWSVGFTCPCGCGDVIELLLLRIAEPHWSLSVDRFGRPTLHPSIWKKTGCKSHFWLRSGRVVWAEPQPKRI
ncbi:DUF6527 family protein [Rhodanobacter spathiphylli]|uniref:DUF6527 family protein n=1 Tax=Rhodanobacter spathiphylli TaxID=347483 RepID=UPI0009FD1E29|nr:DUF6527 family protein [Rhodanobacter spathiphylli]